MESSADKPTGSEAGWRTLSTLRPFKNDVFAVREDKVDLPGGKRKSIAYWERIAAVIIVPVTPKGVIVLINHYRYPVDEWCLEVPAGGIEDAPNESLEECARRELREEVGAGCQSLIYVAFFKFGEFVECYVFLAEQVVCRFRRSAEQRS